MANQININSNGLKAWALLASMESNNVLECIKESLSPQARQSLLLQNSAQLLDIARRHLAALGIRVFINKIGNSSGCPHLMSKSS